MSSVTALSFPAYLSETADSTPVLTHGLHSLGQLSKTDILHILHTALRFSRQRAELSPLHGRLIASLFLEPSTRTALSFAAAAIKLGSHVVSLDHERSRIASGESLEDTLAVIEQSADLLVLRTPVTGQSTALQRQCDIPIINAGDGTGEHPTQALGDLLTILREFGEIDGLRIALVNDARAGRSLHSLALGLSKFDVSLRVIAPQGFELPQDVIASCNVANSRVEIEHTCELDLSDCDVVFVHPSPSRWLSHPSLLQGWVGLPPIDEAVLSSARPGAILLHPGSVGNELTPHWRALPQQRILAQVSNGTLARMAVLALAASVGE